MRDEAALPRPAWLRRAWTPRLKRTLTAAFLLLVAMLLWRLGRELDWRHAAETLRAMPLPTLAAAAALAFASHALYATYDLFGRHLTGHRLPARRVVGVGHVSYAFNLNLGTLVGGVGFRFRLYSRLGLALDVIARVVATSIVTNWIGYALLGGVLLLAWPPALPPAWGIDEAGLRPLGALLLAAVAAYLVGCLRAGGRDWRWRRFTLRAPSARVALLQVGISALNWMLMAAACHVLLRQQLPYPLVLGALLLAAVAGVLAHVPGGLGVIEGTFVALLSSRLPAAEIVGALLAYRTLYYLLPLVSALVLYGFVERAPQGPDGLSSPAPASPR